MLTIGNLKFSNPFVLAPLAGYTDLPFRILCKRYGAAFCVSEMISCHGLVYQQQNTIQMLRSTLEEKPVSFQLFGADIEAMKRATALLLEFKPDLIDINMGCPVKKVTKKGAGAALMTTPDIAEKILRGVVTESTVPVTVKIRAGKDQQHINVVDYAKMAEDCGAAALTVHGRTWAQGFSGESNPQYIAAAKKAVSIPVIGNGDILSTEQGESLMTETGCDGVMIGRGALGNPWVFGKKKRPSTIAGISGGALEHLELMEKYLQIERKTGYVKSQLSRYYKSLPGSSRLRSEIFGQPDIASLKAMLANLAENGISDQD